MGKYDAQAESALDLIREKGGTATIERKASDGTFDPVTQVTTGASAAATAEVQAVRLPAGKSAEFRVGSLVNRNVEQVWVALYGVSLAPKNGDTITYADGSRWNVLWTTVYDPAGDGPIVAMLYAEK